MQAMNEFLTAKDIPDYLNDIYLVKSKNGKKALSHSCIV
jgi:hypothetical protein